MLKCLSIAFLLKFFLVSILHLLNPIIGFAQPLESSSQKKNNPLLPSTNLIAEVSLSGSGYSAPSFMKYSENLLSRRSPDLLFGLDIEAGVKVKVLNILFLGPVAQFYLPDASNLTTVSNEQQLKLSGWAFGVGGSFFVLEAIASNSFSGLNISLLYSMPQITQTQFIGQETFSSSGFIVAIGGSIGFPLSENFNTTLGVKVRGGINSQFSKDGQKLEYSDNDGSVNPVRFNFFSISLQLGLLYYD